MYDFLASFMYKLEKADTIYKNKTKNSKKFYSKAFSIFPGGISHNIRYFKPYPFFVSKSNGKYLYDVDNNKFTDYWMGHWALILGHSHPIVTQSLNKQIKQGTLFGTSNIQSIDLGEIIQKLMPKAERMRFSSTGSEATMYAVRLARAKTKRRIIAKVIGGWHGFNTTLLHSVNYPFELDEGIGLVDDEEQFIESLPFNDLEKSVKILETVKEDLACIIIEPILGGAGCITPEKDYLHGLQEFAKKNGIIFILDEIVTGFRVSINGAQKIYNLDPDLFTLGKIAGGGLPIGIVCGDKDIMNLSDNTQTKDKKDYCAIGGGTFSANPLTMVAGFSTLDFLKKNQNIVYPKINKLGNKVRVDLKKVFEENKISVKITGLGSLFKIHFLNDKVNDIKNALDVAFSNKTKLIKYEMSLMSNHNIFFLPTKLGAISYVHDIKDIDNLIKSTESIIESGVLN